MVWAPWFSALATLTPSSTRKWWRSTCYPTPKINCLPTGSTYMQDNASIHVSASTNRFFEDNNIARIRWPAQSPDLNPIENLWNIMLREVRKKEPKNKTQLLQVLEEEWKKIPTDTCIKLVDSMPKRMAAVIASKGYPTKYWRCILLWYWFHVKWLRFKLFIIVYLQSFLFFCSGVFVVVTVWSHRVHCTKQAHP